MSRLSRPRLASHLQGLDRSSLIAFTVDLWEARGFETTVEGPLVIASRSDERVVICPLPAAHLQRVPSPDRSVDIVLAPAGGRRAKRFAARTDAQVLTTNEIRELLVFAIDEADAAAICRRHFGVGPNELRLPPLRRGLSWLWSTVTPHVGRPAASVMIGLLILTSVVGIAITAGSPGPGPSSDPSSVGLKTPDGTPTRDPVIASTTPVAIEDRVRFPIEAPGVGWDGISNRSALAAAHESGLRNYSYTIWADVHRPRDGRPNASVVQRDIDMRVEGDRYRVTTTIVESSERVRERVLDLYHDGENRYVGERRGEVVVYRTVAANESPTLLPEPRLLTERLVDTYLSTPETALSGIETRDRRTYYRVTGRGTPSGLPGVAEYTVVAMVGTDGVVRELKAVYYINTVDGGYPVTVEVTYDNLYWTTVDPPSWYEPRFGENGTRTGSDS